MSLLIGAHREGPPWPIETYLELTCDGEHGLFPPAPQRFEGNYVLARGAAMRAGWKETFTAAGRHLWLGPCCSGKTPCGADG